jgi:RAB protein geranylgeranyltransferase component A
MTIAKQPDCEAEVISQKADVLIYGTGFIQCMLAAKLSKANKSVFLVDVGRYYGQSFASIPLKDLLKWVRRNDIKENECNGPPLSNVDPFYGVFDSYKMIVSSNFEEKIDSSLMTSYIDMTCFPILAKSKIFTQITDLESGLMDYDLGFFPIKRLDIGSNVWESSPFSVPLSKEDIFMHEKLNHIEKRIWMKILSAALVPQSDGAQEQSFYEWFESIMEKQHAQIPSADMLRFTVYHTIAGMTLPFETCQLTMEEGLNRMKAFATASNSLFSSQSAPNDLNHHDLTRALYLIQEYSSDVLQAFARKACVFGATISLGSDICSTVVNNNEIEMKIIPSLSSYSTSSLTIQAPLIIGDCFKLGLHGSDKHGRSSTGNRAILLASRPILLKRDDSDNDIVAYHQHYYKSVSEKDTGLVYHIVERRLSNDLFFVHFFALGSDIELSDAFSTFSNIIDQWYKLDNDRSSILLELYGSNSIIDEYYLPKILEPRVIHLPLGYPFFCSDVYDKIALETDKLVEHCLMVLDH